MLVWAGWVRGEVERRESGMSKPIGYTDGWGNFQSRDTIYAHQDTRSVKVTYRGEDGSKFRVVVHQKPNPIGFAARQPGDGKTNGRNR